LPLALYAAATGLAEPFAPVLLRARARRGKEDPARLDERLGHGAAARPPGPLVWLHGVSVGESLSLLPLIAALRARRPMLNMLVTSGTATSAQVMAQRLPPGVIHQFAPVDAPRAVARFLDHWRPALGVLVESELWPNLIGAARARGVRLALLSARMTQASAGRWGTAPGSARRLLAAFDLILAQDPATGDRLTRLGGAVAGLLNLKLLGEAPPVDAAELKRLKAAAGRRKVIVAASTHPGEEALIAKAAHDAAPASLLVVAPRHPDRGADLAGDLAAFGPVARRGAGETPDAKTKVYVADTLGEMGTFLSLADLVVLGGGFADRVGGHNPMEAARLGRPVLTGPRIDNAREIFEALGAAGGAVITPDGRGLAIEIGRLLAAPRTAQSMGRAARDFAEGQGGALDHALDRLQPLLPA
jgi:3-deoxy-D-manno-octulosonic-acid transferase